MRVLLIVNTPAELEQSAAFAARISASTDATHLLAIVPVSGDIPTKSNGEVLDVCTEFDLSPMYAERDAYRDRIVSLGLESSFATVQILIGHRKNIVSAQVEALAPDILLTATELTTDVTDFIRHTHAGELRETVSLPVMTYKCDRSREEIKEIALISDFSRAADEIDLSVVKHIAAQSTAQITLYGFVSGQAEIAEMEDRMTRFAEDQAMLSAKQVVIKSMDKEKGAKDLLMDHPMQLMVLVDIHRQGVQQMLFGNLEADILNHTAIPILAY